MAKPASYSTLNIGGPEVFTLKDLALSKMQNSGRKKALVNLPLPGKAGNALKNGALITKEVSNTGMTWGKYLSTSNE